MILRISYMRYFRALLMSLGMFSTLLIPRNIWDDKLLPLMLPCLPVTGAIIGTLWYVIALLVRMADIPPLIQSAAAMLAPFALCGFIHTDGYIDTADAIFSRASLDEKKRILKDPRVGAFGAISLAVLFLLEFCATATIVLSKGNYCTLIFIPILSRCCAGAAMLNMKAMSDTGYAATFKANSKLSHTVFICVVGVLAAATAWLFAGNIAIIVLIVEAIAGVLAMAWTYRQFEGLSGDLCGFIITVGELAGILCLAVLI